MSHDIAVINERAAISYQHETPWHKLGQKMDTADVTTALRAANLDWNVELKPMFFEVDGQSIKSRLRRSVVRDVDHMELATVGNDYRVLQNADAFQVLQPACEQFGVTIETAGALGKGDRVWMLAKLPESIEIVPGDKVDQYFLVMTGHNGWTSYTARGTDVRVVCANTLSVAMAGSRALVSLKHTETMADQMDQVSYVVTKLMSAARVRARIFKELADRKMTPSEELEYISEVLDLDDQVDPTSLRAKRRDKILEMTRTGKGVEFAPNSLWVAFNAVVEYTDHVRPTEVRSIRKIRQTNESALFGANMRLKQRALTIARRLTA